jgi:predicted ribosomally synthesized peptide with nif11-like leader
MKIDEWTAFAESVAGDPEAQAVLRSNDVEKIVALAQSKGFRFTREDIMDAPLDGQSLALDETELDGVSGGHPAIP